jgi:pimeloyl-ACP methyl ester carboxylesterase
LFLVGAHEPQLTIELMVEWHQQVPDAELVVLRDCYHAAHRENAPVWNAAVSDFFARHHIN